MPRRPVRQRLPVQRSPAVRDCAERRRVAAALRRQGRHRGTDPGLVRWLGSSPSPYLVKKMGLLNGGVLRIITGGSFRLTRLPAERSESMPQSTLGPARPATGDHIFDLRENPLQRRAGVLGHPSVLLFVILTAQLMVVLDTTIVNVALPHIQESLGFSSSALSWVLNAYILTFGGFLLLGARVGDLFGRRRVFLIGIAVFTLSSFVGGIAVAGWMLLAARAIQGLGAALAAPSA